MCSRLGKKNKPGPDIFKGPVTTSITIQCPIRKIAYSRYSNRKKLIDHASTGGLIKEKENIDSNWRKQLTQLRLEKRKEAEVFRPRSLK